jgi:hypothetical protein
VFDIKGGNEDKNRVRVEIGGVTSIEWAELRERFLFLTPTKKDEKVTVPYCGDLLLGERFKGKVFVKGIFVQNNPTLSYGYNFYDAEIDRDRKMVESWTMAYKTSQIWKQVAGSRPDLFDSFYSLVEDNKADVSQLEHSSVDKKVSDQAAAKFLERFGKNAVPVSNLAESEDIEHLGAKGVVVPKVVQAILKDSIGDISTVKTKLNEEVVKLYSWSDLSEEQKTNLTQAVTLLQKADPICSLEAVNVADFRSPALQGQYKGGQIVLAAKILLDPHETLMVLVHEWAHRNGGDGEKSHVNTIEVLWRDIVKHLAERLSR